METDNLTFAKKVWGTAAFSLFFIILCAAVLIFLPDDASRNPNSENGSFNSEFEINENDIKELVLDVSAKNDNGLAYYRLPQTRAAVEWFYSRVVNSTEIAKAILTEADSNDIPLSLAFALAHTESSYNVKAFNKNSNGSIDRGLFQLNNRSFPKLTETDFYDPYISAHYGLSHLKFCIKTAGNEIAGLAMYNAGTVKVKKDSTPQITLNYINKIQNYRAALEENFETEVVSFFENNSSRLALR